MIKEVASIPGLPKSLRTRICPRYLELQLVKFSTHSDLVFFKSIIITPIPASPDSLRDRMWLRYFDLDLVAFVIYGSIELFD
jgi:hypothetical protein